jgi:hypothetical protein
MLGQGVQAVGVGLADRGGLKGGHLVGQPRLSPGLQASQPSRQACQAILGLTYPN